MSNFKPDDILQDAILKRNISAIKTCLINFIKFDPIFESNTFEEALKYVNDKNININVSYNKQSDEYKREDRSKWDREYFYLLTEWFRRNFAVKERLPHIKEVGAVVFGGKSRGNNRNENIEDRFRSLSNDKNNRIENTYREVSNDTKLSVENKYKVNSDTARIEKERRVNRYIKKKKTNNIGNYITLILAGVLIILIIGTLIKNI